MKFLLTTVLLLGSSWALAADPLEELPVSFQKFLPTLGDAVHAVGQGQVERSLEALRLDINPATRTTEEATKMREAFLKLLTPVSQLKLKFESYDVMAISLTSSKALTVYGVANGKRGPVHWDFDLFFYEGNWHMHSMHFTINWKRERLIPDRAMYFDKPYVLRLDQREVAQTVR